MTIQQILSPLRKAIEDYRMISAGDRIAVGVSGGKDSLTLAAALSAYQKFSPHPFTLSAVHIDLNAPGTSPEQQKALADYMAQLGVPYTVVKSDIYEIVFEARKEENPCALCSKLRRGMLNTAAVSLGCNKVALGHHADDVLETFLLSLCYEGRLSCFQPVTYLSRTNLTVIRPLIYSEEKNISAFSKELPVLHNPCPANKHTKREYMKELVRAVQKDIPFVRERMTAAIMSPERYNLWEKPSD